MSGSIIIRHAFFAGDYQMSVRSESPPFGFSNFDPRAILWDFISMFYEWSCQHGQYRCLLTALEWNGRRR